MSWKNEWIRRIQKVKFRGKRFTSLDKARLYRTLAIVGLGGVLLAGILTALLFAWYARDLPTPDKIVRREGFATKIFDRNSELLYEVFADQQRTPVAVGDIPDMLKKATVSIEDKEFYTHGGFDITGIMRGGLRFFTRGKAQGGSTLTQQLVKNVLLTTERSVARKVKEFILSVQIERRYSKDQILQMYLNEAPYGGTAWGVTTAADMYFGKSVKDLSLVESAILAGMPQRPTAYSPYGATPDAYIVRTQNVLRRMNEDGYITKEQENQALEDLKIIKFKDQQVGINAPHFVLYVKQLLEDMYGERLVEQGGLKVTTTLDFGLHKKTQAIVTEEIAKVESAHITNGTAVIMDPQTGEILSMVGSKDYFATDYDGQVNVALSLRQPGSSIKPVTFATAFKKGYPPSYMLVDALTEFPGGDGEPYKPQNYTGEYHGPVQLRFALGNSLNVPAVKLLALVGVKDMLQTAYDMGFTTLEPTLENMRRFGLSVTLGGGEVRLIDMVSAYCAFANGGIRTEPISILKVEDKDGKVLYEHKNVKNRRVLDAGVTFLINHVLADNNARMLTFGFNSYLTMGDQVAVKTGTTNDKRDNWTVGWSTGMLVGVWVGNNDNTPMTKVASGVTGASPIWRRIMNEALKVKPSSPWIIPDNVESVLVDSISGYPEHHGFPTRSEYVIKGTLQPLPDPVHAMLKVCKASGKLATEVDVAKGEFDEKEFVVLRENDPLNKDKNSWQEGINGWLSTYGDSKFHPPSEYCDSANELVVKVKAPADQQNFEGVEVPIEVDTITSGEIGKIIVYVDGSFFTDYAGNERDTGRKLITQEEIDSNIQTWKEQVGKIVDFDLIKIKQNGDWLTQLKLKDIIKIGSNISATQLFKRDSFTRRIAKGDVVWYHETMYPLLQGYDSVVMDVDLEIGGTDQEFNMLIGRELQRKMNNREKYVLTTPMINGTDGKKMSKSANNCIWLTDKPEDMYRKIMAMSDNMIRTYYELLTDIPMTEIQELDPSQPIANKRRLAFDITRQFHAEDGAQTGQNYYDTVIQPKTAPNDMAKITLIKGSHTLLEICAATGVGDSHSGIKRNIEGGGVEFDGHKITNPVQKIEIMTDHVLKYGKRNYWKIIGK